MPHAIRILARAADTGENPEAGKFVQSYDPSKGEHGEIVFTNAIEHAKVYPSPLEAYAEWRAQNTSHPLRPDGQPNRPMTAWTIEVVPIMPPAPKPV